MGIGALFIQIEEKYAEKIKSDLSGKMVHDEEVGLYIEQNAISYLDLGKTEYDEIAMILSKTDWGEYDENNIGVQVIYGIGDFEDAFWIRVFDKNLIKKNLDWLKQNNFDDFEFL